MPHEARYHGAQQGGTMSEISATARRELVQALAERYRGATVSQKHQILDEFVAVTG